MLATKNNNVSKTALLIALLYLFFNTVLLPSGLLYTMLLAPLFYIYALKKKQKNILGYFILLTLPYACIHYYLGVNSYFYLRSTALLLLVYLSVVGIYVFIKHNSIEALFPILLKINFWFFVAALLLYFTPFAELLWTFKNLTKTIENFPRIRMLTYEPSYYSLLLSPIAIYYSLKLFFFPINKKQGIAFLFMIVLPLLFSFSLGVLGGIAVTFILLFILKYKQLKENKNFYYSFWGTVIFLISILIIAFLIFPENPLFERIVDLINGKDTSANGRTFNAFWLANEIAHKKSMWFGVGTGQIKQIGAQIIKEYYNYSVNDLASIRIPNTIGETLAMYGYVGLFLRLLAQLILFRVTKVNANFYRTSIFLFIFIYQFTGSFFNRANFIRKTDSAAATP